ncbi:hypothetical protein [Pseudomonas kurunegalensis]|uniref:hypothetical protein n=1 Tax=Pseudomonas kurunegalensis TaxID=485880 RepID=UPI00236423D0|nr:hypothetical protein [Pseudomonas kurunegalensis]MDD2134617.1 hypothetical protein [Pseudomonas kurunegalensis]
MSLPDQLAFLTPYLLSSRRAFDSAPWLLTPFESTVWLFDFGFSKPVELNWDVKLSDGVSLVSAKHSLLLNIFKHWLIAATSNKDGSGFHTTALKSQYVRFNTVLHIIDMLLMNSQEYNVTRFGLETLTANNVTDILKRVSLSNFVAESVYEWSARLREYCLELLDGSDPLEIEQTLRDKPYLKVITDAQAEGDNLSLPLEIIPKVRAALLLNKLYVYNAHKGYNVHSLRVSQVLYKNTLGGVKSQKPIVPILMFSMADEVFTREAKGVPVHTAAHITMSKECLRFYRMALIDLKLLRVLNLPLPPLQSIEHSLSVFIDGGDQGRFETVPSQIMRTSLKKAIKFHKKYGRGLIESYCALARKCKELDVKLLGLSEAEFRGCLHRDLKDLKISKIGLACRRQGWAEWTAPVLGDSAEYFSEVRANAGLLELIAVYFGAIQITVGLLSARRSTELRDLPRNCLDASKAWVLYFNQKSSRQTSATRQLIARPLDPLAIEMLENLQKLHDELSELAFTDDTYPLFSVPGLKGTSWLIKPDIHIYYRNIDLFQDYIQSQFDENGRRYYIRQHQMRRFFALLFYTSYKHASLSTLRWYFGHSNFQHIYNYITASVPGEELRGVRSAALIERLADEDWSAYKSIAKLIKEEFGVENFKVGVTERVDEYLTRLLQKGRIALEPKFFNGASGQAMKVMVLIKGEPLEHAM